MIRYLITDGSAAGDPVAWLANVAHWIRNDIDFLQVREPDLTTRELAALVKRVCSIKSRTKVLINDRADVAIAAGADGVHLRDWSIEPNRIRCISSRQLVVSVACHSVEGVACAARSGADLAILAPIFPPLSKPSTRPPLGLRALTSAAASVKIPVIALGGVTQANAGDCMKAGAAGVGGISLFSTRAKQNR